MDGLKEGVAVFDEDGRLVFANAAARGTLGECNGRDVVTSLRARGARVSSIELGPGRRGQVVYLSGPSAEGTLAASERQAILERLEATGWKLAETAKQLGISRTTLWRRLRAYGVSRVGLGR